MKSRFARPGALLAIAALLSAVLPANKVVAQPQPPAPTVPPAPTAAVPAAPAPAAPPAPTAPAPSAPPPVAPAPPAVAPSPTPEPAAPQQPMYSCTASPACLQEGLCVLSQDNQGAPICIAGSDADCQRSAACQLGQCTAVAGRCAAVQWQDCRRPQACPAGQQCFPFQGRCVAGQQDENGEIYVGLPGSSKGKGLTIAGAVVLGSSALLGTVGIALFANASNNSSGIDGGTDILGGLFGVFFTIIGGAGVTTGAVLLGVGVHRSNQQPFETADAWQPTVKIGPGGGELSWTF